MAPTDEQGCFDTIVFYPCAGDHPDLYFWVEYFIGAAWTTIYHPNPICCHTRWNYPCGNEVLLRVTDPRVILCGAPPSDLPGLQVAVMTQGQYERDSGCLRVTLRTTAGPTGA